VTAPLAPVRAHPWRPDIKVCFAGDVTGYGLLARRLLELERWLDDTALTTVFRCHGTGRTLWLLGDVPLHTPQPLLALARVGQALGMQVACSAALPAAAGRQDIFGRLAAAGPVQRLVLDLGAVPVVAAVEHGAEVARWLALAADLGLDVELRGPAATALATGALAAEWLDRGGFTMRPIAPGRGSPLPGLCVEVGGGLYAGEHTWRTGQAPLGSLHDEPGRGWALVAALVDPEAAKADPIAAALADPTTAQADQITDQADLITARVDPETIPVGPVTAR
jgi:hypothetical protein